MPWPVVRVTCLCLSPPPPPHRDRQAQLVFPFLGPITMPIQRTPYIPH